MVLLPGLLSDWGRSSSFTITRQVKLVSLVLRGERVREELVGEGELMEIQPPADMAVSSLSSQVKENSNFPLSTTAVSTMAEHVRVTYPTPPATRGLEGAERDTEGEETATHNYRSEHYTSRSSDIKLKK